MEVFVDFDHCGGEDESRKDCRDCSPEQRAKCEQDDPDPEKNNKKEVTMELTRRQKAEIKSYFPWYTGFRFQADGTVLAQQHRGGPYGILYTPSQTESHLKCMENRGRLPKLSKAQQAVMNQITDTNLPLDDGTMMFWQIKRHKDGTISGTFNKSTLESLERKGLITIERITTGFNYDTIRVVKGRR